MTSYPQPTEYASHTLVTRLRKPVEAALLFGSVARGDNTQSSDIDILQVTAVPTPSYKQGQMNVSVYSISSLRSIAEQGSLFILHLRTEGQILLDPLGLLRQCLASYKAPSNYASFLSDLRLLANLLDISGEDYHSKWRGLNKLCLFILRSTLFARFAEKGTPCFSLNQISVALGSPGIADAHRLNSCGLDTGLFERTKNIIEQYLQTRIRNPKDTFEALVLECTRQNEFVRFVSLHFLKKTISEDAYEFLRMNINE